MKWIGKQMNGKARERRMRIKNEKHELSTQFSISAINAYEAETVIFGVVVIALGPWQTL